MKIMVLQHSRKKVVCGFEISTLRKIASAKNPKKKMKNYLLIEETSYVIKSCGKCFKFLYN